MSWKFEQRGSFGKFLADPYAQHLMRYQTEEQFSEFKGAYTNWLERKLNELRSREEYREGQNLRALDLEEKFGDILRRLQRKKTWPRNATYLAGIFDNKQMAVIYTLLDDLVDLSERNEDDSAFQAGANAVSAQLEKINQKIERHE